MGEFVVFSLVGPMGSFGDLAGHERRPTGEWPTRSAVLGLVGAALGVKRDDLQGQRELGAWRVTVSVLSRSQRIRDMHTVQAVPTSRIKRPETRRQALGALKSRDNPVVTWRDYLTDCAFGVALSGCDQESRVCEALARPMFVPYLGRKSCPLSAPMAPQIVEADSPAQALTRILLPPFLGLDAAQPLLVASDEPVKGGRQEIRWDEPLDRVSWHFGPRSVYIGRHYGTEDSE